MSAVAHTRWWCLFTDEWVYILQKLMDTGIQSASCISLIHLIKRRRSVGTICVYHQSLSPFSSSDVYTFWYGAVH